jgi:hypothetical protein
MKATNTLCLGKATVVYIVVPLQLQPSNGHYFEIAILPEAENLFFPYDLKKS